jgi:hypothetical protein
MPLEMTHSAGFSRSASRHELWYTSRKAAVFYFMLFYSSTHFFWVEEIPKENFFQGHEAQNWLPRAILWVDQALRAEPRNGSTNRRGPVPIRDGTSDSLGKVWDFCS